jgi:RNA polymerase sigma-70 factor (ECF subfamily)
MDKVGRRNTSVGQRRSLSADNGRPDGFALADLRCGGDEAWSFVVRELAGPLRAFIALRGANDVDGTLGDVFLDMSRNIDRFDGDWANFRSWAFTIARRRLVDDHRYHQRRPAEATSPFDLRSTNHAGGDVEHDAMGVLDTEQLLRLLQTLTPTQREVIFLRFFLALSAPEVASITGSTVTAVRANQRRAIRKLQRLVDFGPTTTGELVLDVTG